jgi:DHA1 family tetracycline resistance protein-like MFS transporter
MLGPVTGGLLGAVHLQLPFFVAGGLALLNLLYGWLVLPESLPPEKRRPIAWAALNPVASMRALSQLKGVGLLVAVIACTGLAQFVLYTTWVLYGHFRFGWGPRESGLSLFAVGVMSVFVQGWLLGVLLKRFTPQRLALIGLLSSSLAYAAWGLSTEGWMMYAVIFANVFGFTAAASIQSIISGAANASAQGQTLGAASSLNSLMSVIAPVISTPLLGMVSHLPAGDWRLGAPLYFCAVLQALALLLAIVHFRGQRRRPGLAKGAAHSTA